VETMITNNDTKFLEDIVGQAHAIYNGLLLFEAVEMDEWEVRFVLESNNISDPELQNKYLSLVKQFDNGNC